MSGAAGERHGVRFWSALVLGGALMAWGGILYLDATPDAGRRLHFVAWVVGLDLVHDAFLAPAVVLLGWGVSRLVGGPWRAPVQAGLVVSGVVLLVAAPPLLGTATAAGNPTIQPLDYLSSTLTVLAAVWVVVVSWGAARILRRPRDGRA